LPLEKINTKCLAIKLLRGNIVDFERNLRNYETPVISRIFKDRVLFDFRTIREDEEKIVIEAILNACEYI
jgi:L-seryl-tRNA(Ser) seleniumtransferase